jgi:hypothetical protein
MMHLQLREDNDSIENEVMLVQIMAVDIPKSRPICESAVNGFMPCPTVNHWSSQEGTYEQHFGLNPFFLGSWIRKSMPSPTIVARWYVYPMNLLESLI